MSLKIMSTAITMAAGLSMVLADWAVVADVLPHGDVPADYQTVVPPGNTATSSTASTIHFVTLDAITGQEYQAAAPQVDERRGNVADSDGTP